MCRILCCIFCFLYERGDKPMFFFYFINFYLIYHIYSLLSDMTCDMVKACDQIGGFEVKLVYKCQHMCTVLTFEPWIHLVMLCL